MDIIVSMWALDHLKSIDAWPAWVEEGQRLKEEVADRLPDGGRRRDDKEAAARLLSEQLESTYGRLDWLHVARCILSDTDNA
jgi:hypothetical protein